MKSLAFANDRSNRRSDENEWAVRTYRRLKVLPPGSPYFIDDLGRVSPRKGRDVTALQTALTNASARTLRRWQSTLCDVLDEICRDVAVIPESMKPGQPPPKRKGPRVTFDFGRDVWRRGYLDGTRVKSSNQRLIAPTLDAFVRYASALLSQPHWRARVTRCEICRNYFIAKKRKGGRRPNTCGEDCAKKRGDPTNAERQRRYRERKRSSVNVPR